MAKWQVAAIPWLGCLLFLSLLPWLLKGQALRRLGLAGLGLTLAFALFACWRLDRLLLWCINGGRSCCCPPPGVAARLISLRADGLELASSCRQVGHRPRGLSRYDWMPCSISGEATSTPAGTTKPPVLGRQRRPSPLLPVSGWRAQAWALTP